MRYILIALLIYSPLALSARKTNQSSQRLFDLQNAVFSFGTYMEAFKELQVDAAGNKNDFEFTPYLGLAAEAKTYWDLIFYPEFFIVLPQKSSLGNITTTVYVLRADIGKAFLNDSLIASIGSSLIITNISGSGSTVRLNNGSSSQTSEFFSPDESRNSINNTLDLGLKLKFTKEYAISAQALIFQAFESERRSFTYTLSLQYYWDGVRDWEVFK